MKSTFISLTFGVLVAACGGNRTSNNNATVAEEAAISLIQSEVKPASAQLEFTGGDVHFTLDDQSLPKSIIPPVFFRAYDAEEGEGSDNRDHTVVSLMGNDAEHPEVSVTFELVLEGKPVQGKNRCQEGNLMIHYKNGEGHRKTRHVWKVSALELDIERVREMTFVNDLKGFDLAMSFSGQVQDSFSGESLPISGTYSVAY